MGRGADRNGQVAAGCVISFEGGADSAREMGADALKALGESGGTVLKTSPSEDAVRELQEALHGTPLAA